MSTVRQILSVNSIVGLALVFGLVNNLAIAGIFGLNRSLDAYFASAMMVKLFMFLIVDYLGKNFLPIYAAKYEVSREEAAELTSLVVTQFALIAGLMAAAIYFFSEQLFALILPGFSEEEIGIVIGYFSVMAPSIVLMTINAFHAYVWQYNEKYNRVVVARLFIPLGLTVAILGFGLSFGTSVLPYGFLCGHAVTAVILAWGIPYRFRFRIGPGDRDFLKIVRNSGVLISTGFIARSRGMFEQYFGSQLGDGAISALAIAHKICQPVFHSALVGIQMILFSRSTKAMARRNLKELARLYNQGFLGVFLLTVPVAIWYLVDGELIVTAVFQRGAFTEEMGHWVYTVLIGLSGSIICMGAVQMASNAFYAMDKVGVPAAVMPVGTIAYVAIAAFMVPAFGLLGLAATSSIVSAIILTTMFIKLRSAVSEFALGQTLLGLLKYLVAAVLAAAATKLVGLAVDVSAIIDFIASMITFGVVYLALVWASGDALLRAIVEKSGLLQRFGAGGSS